MIVRGDTMSNQPTPSAYRRFLDQIQIIKLRQGFGQWRLVGNGLIVPNRGYSDSREWEVESKGHSNDFGERCSDN